MTTKPIKQRVYESSLRSKGHKQIRIWLTPDLQEALRVYRDLHGTSYAKIYEQALEGFLGAGEGKR